MDCLLKPKELQEVHVGELLEAYCSLTKELFSPSQDRKEEHARRAFGGDLFLMVHADSFREPLTTLHPSSIVAIMSLSALPKQKTLYLEAVLVHPLLQGQGMMQRILKAVLDSQEEFWPNLSFQWIAGRTQNSHFVSALQRVCGGLVFPNDLSGLPEEHQKVVLDVARGVAESLGTNMEEYDDSLMICRGVYGATLMKNTPQTTSQHLKVERGDAFIALCSLNPVK